MPSPQVPLAVAQVVKFTETMVVVDPTESNAAQEVVTRPMAASIFASFPEPTVIAPVDLAVDGASSDEEDPDKKRTVKKVKPRRQASFADEVMANEMAATAAAVTAATATASPTLSPRVSRTTSPSQPPKLPPRTHSPNPSSSRLSPTRVPAQQIPIEPATAIETAGSAAAVSVASRSASPALPPRDLSRAISPAKRSSVTPAAYIVGALPDPVVSAAASPRRLHAVAAPTRALSPPLIPHTTMVDSSNLATYARASPVRPGRPLSPARAPSPTVPRRALSPISKTKEPHMDIEEMSEEELARLHTGSTRRRSTAVALVKTSPLRERVRLDLLV
jgi:hypothetical protein